MNIKYLGHSSFKITGKTQSGQEVAVVIDPFAAKSVGPSYPKQTANIVTLSHGHPDHSDLANIAGTNGKDYIVLDTPGEYEIDGLIINGVKSFRDDKEGKERGTNTIYVYDFNEARVAHLGDLGHVLNNEQLEELEDIDVLMIPVGGIYTIDPKTAIQVIEELDPAVVIPMHYKTARHASAYAELAELEDFIKEMGLQPNPVKEYNLKAHKDLPAELSLITFGA